MIFNKILGRWLLFYYSYSDKTTFNQELQENLKFIKKKKKQEIR